MHPQKFLNDYVDPSINDWIAQPLSVRHAIIALGEIDNLAEHFIHHTNPTLRQITQVRDTLGSAVHELAIARDVHDTHKHGALSRKTATITREQKPTQVQVGGAFSADAFSTGFDVGVQALVVTEDNRDRHYVEDVIREAMNYWRSEIAKLPT
jgi:hypothetical protein